jgi:cyclopropane fatty-acyl-phospholipid synthase-like methyltransferase
MIDSDKVRAFWKTRGDKLDKLPFESIANLEEKPDLLQMKITLEQEKIMPLLPLQGDAAILDLGAGVGQWSFRFAPKVKQVIAVEYTDALADIGRQEAAKRGLTNVEFITSPAECFQSPHRFDVIFISGLFVYLNEDQSQQLMNHLPTMLKPNGTILLRDGTSILNQAHYINNRYSDILSEQYSALYRTRNEYVSLFEKAGFNLIQDGQVFDEGCPLNKFPETRLWYYLFNN